MFEPTLTCQDTDDPEYWADRLNAADKEDCERLLYAMLRLGLRLQDKGIPTPGCDLTTEASGADGRASDRTVRLGDVFCGIGNHGEQDVEIQIQRRQRQARTPPGLVA